MTMSQDGFLQYPSKDSRVEEEFLLLEKSSMRKTPFICSLLMAFGLSIVIGGCEPANKAGSGTKSAKVKGPGSTTGGGTEVPVAPSKGSAEAPKMEAPKMEDPKAEAPKTDAAPAGEEKPKEAEPAPEKAKTDG